MIIFSRGGGGKKMQGGFYEKSWLPSSEVKMDIFAFK